MVLGIFYGKNQCEKFSAMIENGFNTKKSKGIIFENDLLSSVSCNNLLYLIKTY